MDHKELEEGCELKLDFDKLSKMSSDSGVIPVAVQNIDTKEIILIAYTNEFAFKETLKTKILTVWSTSRNELWIKGKSSGNTFKVLDIRVNCEQNSLVYFVRPENGDICHTNNSKGEPRNCYYRSLDFDNLTLKNLDA